MSQKLSLWASTMLLILSALAFSGCSSDYLETPKYLEVTYRIDVKSSSETPFTIDAKYTDDKGASISVNGHTPFEKTIRNVSPYSKIKFSGFLTHMTTKKIVGTIQMIVKNQESGRVMHDLKKMINIVENKSDGSPISSERVKSATTFSFEY